VWQAIFFQQVVQIEALGFALKTLDFASGKLKLLGQDPDPVFHVSQFIVGHSSFPKYMRSL
jgi:hypothetical protein